MAQDMNDLEPVIGLTFTHPETGCEYGAIRRLHGKSPVSVVGFTPFAEDECGNAFVRANDSSVHFWDHETDELTRLALDWKSFIANCEEPRQVELDPSQVKSAWIDPEFAKQLGIQVPPDGWKKKP
jgi:hypothetical protein